MLAFRLVFYGVSVPLVLVAPLVATRGTRALQKWAHRWSALQRWSARHLLGIDIRVEGQRQDGPALYAAKHQAMFETLELAALLDGPAIVMKAELARIPVWGWAARRYGAIVVDRTGSGRAMREMLREARIARDAGRSVLIFPEGTRVDPGETPPLRPGFAGLYKALGLPVVPVALDTGTLLPRNGPARRGTITLRFGDPIPPGLSRVEAEARVHAGINVLEK